MIASAPASKRSIVASSGSSGAPRSRGSTPTIVEKVEFVTRGDVRRAKLYYLRDRVGKAAKIKEKRDN